MTPIISPWVIYFSSIADQLNAWSGIFGSLLFIAAVVAFICAAVSKFAWEDDDEYEVCKTIGVKSLKIAALLLAIAIITPGETTITKMVVAHNVTYERVEAAADTVETVYNDIMELFEEEE